MTGKNVILRNQSDLNSILDGVIDGSFEQKDLPRIISMKEKDVKEIENLILIIDDILNFIEENARCESRSVSDVPMDWGNRMLPREKFPAIRKKIISMKNKMLNIKYFEAKENRSVRHLVENHTSFFQRMSINKMLNIAYKRYPVLRAAYQLHELEIAQLMNSALTYFAIPNTKKKSLIGEIISDFSPHVDQDENGINLKKFVVILKTLKQVFQSVLKSELENVQYLSRHIS